MRPIWFLPTTDMLINCHSQECVRALAVFADQENLYRLAWAFVAQSGMPIKSQIAGPNVPYIY